MMSPTSATSEVDFNARTDVVSGAASPMQQARQKNVSRDNNWWFFIGISLKEIGHLYGFMVTYADFTKNQDYSDAS